MADTMHTGSRAERQPALKELSASVAHMDAAVLLGVGMVAGLTVVAGRRFRSAALLTAGGASATALALVLRLGRQSGVTAAELQRTLPGDELITAPNFVTNRAVTIPAPVGAVWPWIVQMGYHRGGWYTNPRLDRLIWHIDNPSADRIQPELQDLRVGDIVPDGPPGTARFTVAAIEPGRALVLLDDAGTHVPGTRFSWTFVLEPIDGRATRLQVRTRATYTPGLMMALLCRLVIGPADYVMVSGQMLRGIKRRIRAAPCVAPSS